MIVGVIGSGSIGPDLAYGFVSALANEPGSRVILLDIQQEALDRGMERIGGYMKKGVARGKISPRAAEAMRAMLTATRDMQDLAPCDYVLEAATEDLPLKQRILGQLEGIVSEDCLVGFSTSGLPRARIAAEARHPGRCFVNHPFFPAWRALPVEVVLGADEGLNARMLTTLRRLGKVPVVTADVPCFAADDIFCNYCAEAARLRVEGVATCGQIDKVVNDAVGGGGPFLVMDLTRGNLLNVKCLNLMAEADTGTPWFRPPEIFSTQANTPWLDRAAGDDGPCDETAALTIRERILAVLLARTLWVAENGVCEPGQLDWLTRNALGFSRGLLDLAHDLGCARVKELCEAYAADHPGFVVPRCVQDGALPDFRRHVQVERRDGVATVTIFRPEVLNALNEQTMAELDAVFAELDGDDSVSGVILQGSGGSLAGADINELAALKTPSEAADKCRRGHAVLRRIAGCSKPVVAAVNGPVLGGGCELSMACHARVTGENLMLGQPEVNLGIIPGYGGTQRLARLIGVERAAELLRTGRTVGAKEACDWGWASGEPAADPVAAARALLQSGAGIAPVDPAPLELPAQLPELDLGHHSLAIDHILCEVILKGLARPLDEGLEIEAEGFARCKQTVDYTIGMTNFIQNGPRVPAVFMNE